MSRYWNLDKVMRFVLFAIGASISVALIYYLRGVLFPFFAAFLIAYIADPIVNWLQGKVKHRIIAVIIVLLCAGCILFGIGKLFIPEIVKEVRTLGVLIAKMFTDSEWSSRLNEFLPANLWDTIRSLVSWDKIAEAMQSLDFWNEVQSIAGKVLPGAWGVLSYTGTIAVWFSSGAVIFMYLVFIMLDMHKLRSGLVHFIPQRFRNEASLFAKETDKFMGNYFRAQALVALTVGVLYAIGFGVMGLPMGVAFGLFSGALNMIPYMQLTTIPLALLLAIVHALNSGLPFWEVALIICSIYLVVQIIQDFFLVPHIVGKSMDLPPVGILLSLSIWGKLLGFLGLLVAIPFTCLCLVYLKKINDKAEQTEEAQTAETSPDKSE